MMNLLRVAACCTAFGLSACNGAGQAQCSNPIPIALTAPPAMYSPAPGTTGLPTSGVVIDVTYDPPNGALRAVAQGTGTTIFGGPFTPATASGTATPPPGVVMSALPALAPHTTYEIFVDAVYPPAPPCGFGGRSGPVSFDLGAISTQ